MSSQKDCQYQNKVNIKVGLRKKWYESEHPATQIALYKLIGTDEESNRINSQFIKAEVKTEITDAIIKAFDWTDETDQS